MSNEPVGGTVIRVRRRRTRRHRRNRKIRIALLATFGTVLTLGFAAIALRHLSPSLFHASRNLEPSRQAVELSHDHFLAAQQAALQEIEKRPVYKYSVVPGGVRSPQELKWAAEHDPVVAAHYAGFDYDHARVVRLVLARTAYVSYRIGNRVYWTRHRVSLKKGETVITDGRMTARTRCANRVEEVPQQATSQSEPPVAKFDEPVSPAIGTATANPPAPFKSSLEIPRQVATLGPPPRLGLYDPLATGQGWIPIAPPPLPQVCGPIQKKPGAQGAVVGDKGKKKKVDICQNGGSGGEVPEPGTWLLVGSGLAFLMWKARDRFVRA